MTSDYNGRAHANQRNDSPGLARLKYETPVLARIELAAVITGSGGSQIDVDASVSLRGSGG